MKINLFVVWHRGSFREYLGQGKVYLKCNTSFIHLAFFFHICYIFFLLPHLLGQNYLPILLENKWQFIAEIQEIFQTHYRLHCLKISRSWVIEHSRWQKRKLNMLGEHQKKRGLSWWFFKGVYVLNSLLTRLKRSIKH